MSAAEGLVRLYMCAVSTDPSLSTYAISTKTSCVGCNVLFQATSL